MVESIQSQIIQRELGKLPRPAPPHVEQQIAALEKHTQRNEFAEDVWAHTLKATDLNGKAIPQRSAQLILLSSIFGIQRTAQIFDESQKNAKQ